MIFIKIYHQFIFTSKSLLNKCNYLIVIYLKGSKKKIIYELLILINSFIINMLHF